MKSAFKNRTILIIIDTIIFILCIFGIYRIALKAYLPFNVTSNNSYLIINEILTEETQIALKDTILTVDGYKFQLWEEVELYTDGKNINDRVNISYLNNGQITYSSVVLINYYSTFEVVTIGFVASLFIFLSLFVVLKSDEGSAILFHWANVGLAIVIAATSANYTVEPKFLSRFLQMLFLLAFCLTPIFFMHFISNFIGWTNKTFRFVLLMFYSIGFILACYLSYSYWLAVISLTLGSIQHYISIYNFIFRPFLLLCIVGITSVLIFSFIVTKDSITKKKLKWLLFGFLIGPLAFAILWLFPLLFFGHPYMPEYLMHLLLISFPVAIAIAIVKYQMMDIDLILRRSMVYSIAVGGLILTYIILLTLITELVKGINETIPAVIAAVMLSLVLQPVKNKVQKFVDKKFFRLVYDYREEQKRFLEDIKNTNDIQSLAEKIVSQTEALIPVEKIGFFILNKPLNRIRLLAHKGFDILVGRSLKFDEENLKTDLPLPIAVDDNVEVGVNVEAADLKVFRRWGIVLIFPVKSTSGEFHAFVVLGAKKAGSRFLNEDIDLLNTISDTAALTIDRIKLQEELIIEHFESERLEELNKMKSFFVSNVTHELKTPLTSIKMFAELLKEKEGFESEKSQEYLEIIEGESDRLRRLIDNVLDFAKIERGIKTYEKSVVDFNHLSLEVLNLMQYQFKMSKIQLKTDISTDKTFITADKDAVEEAMMNILSNAIKYSEQNTSVSVSTFKRNSYVCFKVADEGIGISESDLKDIFNPFFRTKNNDVIKAEGTGLGLSIVKHIVDAHDGKIEVESKPGKGSTFHLLFPILNEEDEKSPDESGRVTSYKNIKS
jgi:signal transduction histidine kinase